MKYTKLSRTIFRRSKIILDNSPAILYNNPMKKYKKKPWSEAERNILKQYYYHASIDEVMHMIPERSETAIRNQVAYLRKRSIRFK